MTRQRGALDLVGASRENANPRIVLKKQIHFPFIVGRVNMTTPDHVPPKLHSHRE